jgi:hypothetical protein
MNTSSAKALSLQHLTKAETARISARRFPHSEFRMDNFSRRNPMKTGGNSFPQFIL